MAFSVKQNDDELAEQSDINVTPFIDVMLVLLIIFMVAAPLATVSVPVTLPGSPVDKPQASTDPLYLTLQQDLTITLGNDKVVPLQELASTLMHMEIPRDEPIFLRADTKVEYGQLMELMTALGQAGFSQLALVGLEKSV